VGIRWVAVRESNSEDRGGEERGRRFGIWSEEGRFKRDVGGRSGWLE
jgi:hypothetical protein